MNPEHLKPVAPSLHKYPFYGVRICAGFPSPSEDWMEDVLSLDELLIKRPAATFLLRVNGNSMNLAGINDGAVLVVDRSVNPKAGQIVVASVDGDFTVKELIKVGNNLALKPANPNYPVITITNDTVIWGVVTAAINQFTGVS